jgi:hypothetical protein
VTAEDYVRRVGFALVDLPWKTKRDLLAELREHLAELPQEMNLVERLGAPEQYAAELRGAAGLDRRRGAIAFLRARRPRNLVLTAAALTVLGLAIGAVAWVDSYQPLVFAGATQDPLDSKPTPGAAGVTVVFHEGRPFLYGLSIHNDGRFTVRVLGIPKSVTDFYSGELLMSKDQTGRLDERPLERFHPFDMRPGSFRWLVFKGVYACTTGIGAGAGVTRAAIAIRYRFLWRTATAWIPLADPLSITFPTSCPPEVQR